jgi:hypothetical protein
MARVVLAGVWAAVSVVGGVSAADLEVVAFRPEPGRLVVLLGGAPAATYVVRDETITRPYFAHLRAGGVPVTRTHPPVKGTDPIDHPTMHPGLWLAFGDLSGADHWRNKAKVVHAGFAAAPAGGAGRGTFAVRNRYLAADGTAAVCEETCRYTVLARPGGTPSPTRAGTRRAGGELVFGDQEEMGLGVRVATPLAVKQGGRITNSLGGVNEKQVWGRPADWCDYQGVVGGTRVGVTLMPDPKNFRPSWFHVRDYGLMVANPFGRKSLGKGEPSRVAVPKGEVLRLRFGVRVYATPAGRPEVDVKAEYADYLAVIAADGR